MILCIDIGNTRIRCALGTKTAYRQAAIDTVDVSDASCFATFLQEKFGKDMQEITGGIYSSVVPQKNADVLQAIDVLNKNAIIRPVDVGQMSIDFTGYKSVLGEDRAVCSHIAVLKHKAPVIVIDFGTATTINFVNQDSAFVGGAILAGVQTGIDALARGTARLPQLDVTGNGNADTKIIGEDTYECLVSGAVVGAAFAATGYIRHIGLLYTQKSIPCPEVVITGGNAPRVMPHCDFRFTYEPNLLIEGLFNLYESTL